MFSSPCALEWQFQPGKMYSYGMIFANWKKRKVLYFYMSTGYSTNDNLDILSENILF